MKKIIPGVSTFTGLIVGRVYLIEDADGLTVIDTGLDLAANQIVRQLQAIGRTAADVKRIVITHAHPDHIGGLPRLKALTGAQVIASSIECPVIEGKIPIPRRAGGLRSSALSPLSSRQVQQPRDELSGAGRALGPPMARDRY